MDRRRFLSSSALAALALSLPAPATPQNEAGAISIEKFGASPANSAAAHTRAINAAIAAVEDDAGLTTVYFPAKRYACGNIRVRRGRLVLSMEGCTLHGSGVRFSVDPEASDVRVLGGHWIETSGRRSTYLFTVNGERIEIIGTTFEKAPAAYGGYMGYVRAGTKDCLFDRFHFRGGNGIYIEGEGHQFTNFTIEAAPPPGGDDSFAIKAIAGVTSGIRIGPGRIKNYAAVISIGSEIGTLGKDDPRHSKVVRDVIVRNIVAEACSHVALIKPGAISAYDYRDGLVEDVLIENVTLSDPTGARFQRGIAVTAARGAQVRRVTSRNVRIRARAYKGTGIPTVGAMDCYIVDYPGGTAAFLSDIDLQASYSDPYDGKANAPATPGHPVQYIARAALQTPGKGQMQDITFDVEGNGCKEIGILIGEGLDGAVEVKRAVLTNISVDPSSTLGRGGIFFRSRVKLGDLYIQAVNGSRLAGPVH